MFEKVFSKMTFAKVTVSTIAVGLVAFASLKIYQRWKPDGHGMKSPSPAVNREIAGEGSRAYSFGGSCTSQGSWTQQALTQTSIIRDAINTLKNDPNCNGIEGIVAKLETAKNAFDPGENKDQHANWEGLPADLKALSHLAGKDGASDRKDIIPLLMGKTIENTVLAGNVKSLAERSRRSLMTGLDFLDQSMDVLPQMDECLSSHPDQLLSIFGASLKLTSAFISSGETAVGRMGTTVAKLVTFLQKKKYSKVLRKLNQTEYWMSLSCILETTTESYCSTRDAYQMLQYSLKETDLKKKLKEFPDNNPLEGYYLLVRELPIITAWIQKVQSGVTPRRSADLTYNSETLDNYTEFKKVQLKLMVTYAEQMELIANARPEEKPARVLNMLKSLDELITRGLDSSVNFYTSGKQQSFIPFFLLGRTSVPDEVSGRGTYSGRNPMNIWTYIEAQNELIATPDSVANKIGEKLKDMNNSAAESASKYFQDRMVVDTQNLVDESLTSQSLTVFRSLENVSSYLDKLINKSKSTRKNLIQLPNMIDTKNRIDDVLVSYKRIKDHVKKYLDMQSEIDTKEDRKALDQLILKDKELKESYSVIVDKAYKNFNILSQNDTYLITRLSTFVKKDYTQRVSEGDDMSEAQRDLMIIAGKNLMNRIGSVNQMNPNDVRLDLSSAQVINQRNIDAIEELFSDQFVGMIAEVKDVVNSSPNDNKSININSIKRVVSEKIQNSDGSWKKGLLMYSLNPIWGMTKLSPGYQLLTSDYIFHRERYPLYLFSPNRVKSEEDANGSFALFMSRLCIQALAFKNQDPFYVLCNGTSLSPVISDNAKDQKRLSIYYAPNSSIGRSGFRETFSDNEKMINLSRKARESNICAYRDFRNKNYAYWMVKNFADDVAQLRSDLKGDDE